MEYLETVKIRDDLYYVGTNDRETELFESMWPLPNGVAYNSYIVKGKQNVLIDLVKINTISIYLEKIREVLGDEKVDYIIINHMEPDHSSSLLAILEVYPDAILICSKKAVDMIKNFYQVVDNIKTVKEKEELQIGDKTFTFFMTPMVHWPESMVTYDASTKTLFSQDIFGGFGTLDGAIFDDEIQFNTNYLEETTRYFINIVGKYAKQALKALNKLADVEIDMICPVHGPIWRKDPKRILDLYTSLANQETIDGVVIIYGSMYGNTRKMAETVARGVSQAGVSNIKIRDITKTNPSYLLSDCWRYRGIVIGSCSYDNNLFPPMSNLMNELSHQRMKNNIWAIFGSFLWSGGALKTLKQFVEDGKYDVLENMPEIQGAADADDLKALYSLGYEIGQRVLNKENI